MMQRVDHAPTMRGAPAEDAGEHGRRETIGPSVMDRRDSVDEFMPGELGSLGMGGGGIGGGGSGADSFGRGSDSDSGSDSRSFDGDCVTASVHAEADRGDGHPVRGPAV